MSLWDQLERFFFSLRTCTLILYKALTTHPFLLKTSSRGRLLSPARLGWLELSALTLDLQWAAHQTRPQPWRRLACSRAIFERVPASCICSWRSSCSNHIFAGAGRCVVCGRDARDSRRWSPACNTDIVSTCCSPLRPTSHPFLKCKNLISNTRRFSSPQNTHSYHRRLPPVHRPAPRQSCRCPRRPPSVACPPR